MLRLSFKEKTASNCKVMVQLAIIMRRIVEKGGGQVKHAGDLFWPMDYPKVLKYGATYTAVATFNMASNMQNALLTCNFAGVE
jgi:hypothetical protein